MRTYHEDGTRPPDDSWVWVFGSNLAGRHGAGAARVAYDDFDYPWGMAEGRAGHAYAIPTKDAGLHTLPLTVIQGFIGKFVVYAREQGGEPFYVTAIGCGLAGLDHADVAPLFRYAPDNCSFPEPWRELLDPLDRGPLS